MTTSEIVAHPPMPPLTREGFAEEYPFESHFLEWDGQRYHYLDEGAGEPLLFVHGNPTWSFAWRHLVREFSQDYRVLAVDHMGCGFSAKPQKYDYTLAQHIANLQRFVEALNLNRITLIAHDWGGAIGMGTAGRMPERFARFILLNTAAFRSQQIPFRIAVCRLPLLGPLGVRGLNLFSRAALRMAVSHPDSLTPAACRGYVAPYNSWANRIAVLRFVQDIPLKPSHPSYRTLVEVEENLAQFQHSPMRFIWGMQDWCFTPAFLEEFQQRFPQADTVTLDDAGHYVFEDARDRLPGHIRDFLEAHPLS